MLFFAVRKKEAEHFTVEKNSGEFFHFAVPT